MKKAFRYLLPLLLLMMLTLPALAEKYEFADDLTGRTAPWAVPRRSPRRFSSSPRSATAAGDGSRETESTGCSAAAPERIQNR